MIVELKVTLSLGESDYKGNNLFLDEQKAKDILKAYLRKAVERADYQEPTYAVDIKAIS